MMQCKETQAMRGGQANRNRIFVAKEKSQPMSKPGVAVQSNQVPLDKQRFFNAKFVEKHQNF
jgi:hypothetical protein